MGRRMESYPKAAVERAMTMQEVILRAMAKKISWWQAAEILGIGDRVKRVTLPRSKTYCGSTAQPDENNGL